MITERSDPQRILLVGGAGFFGQHFVNAAETHFPRSELVLTSRSIRQGDHWLAVDPLNWVEMRHVLRRVRPDCVVNFVGTTSGAFHHQLQLNAVFPLMLAHQVASLSRDTRLVLIGSAAEYGVSKSDVAFREDRPLKPISLYGFTKCDQSAAFSNIKALVHDSLLVRPFNLYGAEAPAQSLFARLRDQLAGSVGGARHTIRTGFLGDFRDFIDVDEASTTLAGLIRRALPGAVCNIGRGVAKEVRQLALSWIYDTTGVPPDSLELVEMNRRSPNYSRADTTTTAAIISSGGLGLDANGISSWHAPAS